MLGCKLANSRTQKGYDLECVHGERVQVKYLCNPSPSSWRNEHHIRFAEGVSRYALVIFIAWQVETVLIFNRTTLAQVGALLKKRHPHQENILQFTRRNYVFILSHPQQFEEIGVKIYRFPHSSNLQASATPTP